MSVSDFMLQRFPVYRKLTRAFMQASMCDSFFVDSLCWTDPRSRHMPDVKMREMVYKRWY